MDNIISFFVNDRLIHLNLLSESSHTEYNFYVSDYTDHFQKKTKLFFPAAIILEEENIFS